jgi:hypothetical protein
MEPIFRRGLQIRKGQVDRSKDGKYLPYIMRKGAIPVKKWLSFTLVFLMLFTWIPVTHAKAKPVHTEQHQSDKGKKEKPNKPAKAKKEKANGTVTAVDVAAGKLTMDARGQTLELVVDSHTKLKLSGWKSPTLADVWKGDSVKAEYNVVEGINTALSIQISKKKGSVNGKVEAIDREAKTFVVNGKTIHTTEQTEWKLKDKKGTLDDLIEGDQVSVSGYVYGEESKLLAVSVKVKRTLAFVKGNVTPVDVASQTILLGEVKVVVADDTKLRLNGREAALGDIMPGDKVVATGQKTAGVFAAKIVEVQRDTVKLEGPIESIDVSAGTVTVGGKVLAVTDATKIEREDQTVTLAELAVGVQVKVRAMQQGETWLALKIEVKDEDQDEDDGENEDEDEGDR